MKKTYLALAIAATTTFASQAVMAQNYQMEVDLNYTSFDYDAGGDDSAIGAGFRYHFKQVSTANRPLAEAAFIGRNGSANVNYLSFDKDDVTALGLGADYWFEDIYVAANLTNTDDDVEDYTDITLTAGYMLKSNLRVTASLIKSETYDDSTGLGFGAKSVYKIGGNFVNAQADLNMIDGNFFVDLAGDYFLNNALSVGATVGLVSWDDKYDFRDDDMEIGLNARYFFMPNISGEVSYTLNNGNGDGDSALGLGVTARF